MSVRKGLAAVVTGLALVLGAAAPAQAVEEGWSCSAPPAGWTFTGIQQRSGYCGSPYPVILYNLALPRDGLVACAGLRDWAVTSSRSSYNGCGINSVATQVWLATPVEGLWSCTIPRGWTYRSSRLTMLTICPGGGPDWNGVLAEDRDYLWSLDFRHSVPSRPQWQPPADLEELRHRSTFASAESRQAVTQHSTFAILWITTRRDQGNLPGSSGMQNLVHGRCVPEAEVGASFQEEGA